MEIDQGNYVCIHTTNGYFFRSSAKTSIHRNRCGERPKRQRENTSQFTNNSLKRPPTETNKQMKKTMFIVRSSTLECVKLSADVQKRLFFPTNRNPNWVSYQFR